MLSDISSIRSAVVGYGEMFNMGKKHGEYMMRSGFEFVAVCDLDPRRTEQAKQDFPGIQTFNKVEELLARPDIHLVTVITPHHTHARLAEQVLRSGKHCILEKPMCIHAEDATRLIRLAEEKSLMLSVYHNRRWDGWYLTVQDLLQRGVLGDIFHVEMFHGGYVAPDQSWRASKEASGGAFYVWGAHYIDYLLGLISGNIRSVRGFIHNRVWHGSTNEDQVDSIIAFENGAVAHVQQSSIARANKVLYRILGTKGAVVVNRHRAPLELYTDVDGANTKTEIMPAKDRHELFYDNIADHLQRRVELTVKPEEARRVIAIIETTEKSAEEGRELTVPFEG